MISGRSITLGGKEYLIPSLTARALIELEREGFYEKVGNSDTKPGARMSLYVRVIHAALVRNYPDLSVDTLLDCEPLELGRAVGEAMKATNGGRVSEPGEASGPTSSSTSSGS
jgi:hypothetical protein